MIEYEIMKCFIFAWLSGLFRVAFESERAGHFFAGLWAIYRFDYFLDALNVPPFLPGVIKEAHHSLAPNNRGDSQR